MLATFLVILGAASTYTLYTNSYTADSYDNIRSELKAPYLLDNPPLINVTDVNNTPYSKYDFRNNLGKWNIVIITPIAFAPSRHNITRYLTKLRGFVSSLHKLTSETDNIIMTLYRLDDLDSHEKNPLGKVDHLFNGMFDVVAIPSTKKGGLGNKYNSLFRYWVSRNHLMATTGRSRTSSSRTLEFSDGETYPVIMTIDPEGKVQTYHRMSFRFSDGVYNRVVTMQHARGDHSNNLHHPVRTIIFPFISNPKDGGDHE